jgi:dTDP-4-amino-4,6-dideoxygalactose transaminase
MRVPLLDLSEQYRQLAGPIRDKIDKVLATQRFILGENVAEFERTICDYLKTPHAIGVSSGTDALLIALMALGIGPGDAVIVPAYSFFATAGCVARLGATPVFVDVDLATYNISADAVRACLKRRTEKIRAIIPVHLFGLVCDMDAMIDIAREFELKIIEDAAQAIGAEYPSKSGNRVAGTMSDIGCFSFYPTKNLSAAGDAGLVICQDVDLAKRLRILRQHGMEPRYFHEAIGGNFRLDEIQAAILAVKLPHLNEWTAARRAAADVYREEFTRAGLIDKVILPVEPYRTSGLTNHHVYHQFVIRTPKRDELRAHLTKREIGTEIYYPLGLHEQKALQFLGYKRGDFPHTEQAARETLALPFWPEISRNAQRYVVSAVADFFS